MGIVVKVDKDAYVEWSGIVDAPVSFVLDRDGAVVRFGEDRVRHADERGTSARDVDPVDGREFVRDNRAGPRETCITPDAILEYYASAEAHDAFVLTPAKIQPYKTEDRGQLLWVPWAPQNVPVELPEDFFERRYEEPVSA